MADKIILSGIHPDYDGEHEIPESFTMQDWETVWRLAKVGVNDMDEALKRGRMGVIVALSVIVLQNKGLEVQEDLLWKADPSAYEQKSEPEVAADPPEDALDQQLVVPVSSASSSEPSELSGSGSNGISEHSQDDAPSPTGEPASVTPLI